MIYVFRCCLLIDAWMWFTVAIYWWTLFSLENCYRLLMVGENSKGNRFPSIFLTRSDMKQEQETCAIRENAGVSKAMLTMPGAMWCLRGSNRIAFPLFCFMSSFSYPVFFMKIHWWTWGDFWFYLLSFVAHAIIYGCDDRGYSWLYGDVNRKFGCVNVQLMEIQVSGLGALPSLHSRLPRKRSYVDMSVRWTCCPLDAPDTE